MAVNPQSAVLALDGGDPRLNNNVDNVVPAETYSRRDVSFEEYMYYAAITRAEEKEANARYIEARGPKSFKKIVGARFSKGHSNELATVTANESVGEKSETENGAQVIVQNQHYITPSQEKTTSRAIRTASWGTIFYLITTDILGPTGAPTLQVDDTASSGWVIWKVFLGLDSDKYPIRGYGDFFYRMFGPAARHFINVSQSLQLLLVVSVLILLNGQSISQISRGPSGDQLGLCFVACPLIYMVAGFVLGQIRTLQRLGWLANVCVWLNLAMILLWYEPSPSFMTLVETYWFAAWERSATDRIMQQSRRRLA
ncbi:hypothetical protein LQW54_008058 [Pestalotiopsis sp. IQ-011]